MKEEKEKEKKKPKKTGPKKLMEMQPRINTISLCAMYGYLLAFIWMLALGLVICAFTEEKYVKYHGLMYKCPTFAESEKS